MGAEITQINTTLIKEFDEPQATQDRQILIVWLRERMGKGVQHREEENLLVKGHIHYDLS